jgi:hypothetical protein
MNDQFWGDKFIEATQAVLDALSHVDEFDASSFMSSVFQSSKYLEDVNSQVAKIHAEQFIKVANKLISTLMTYRLSDKENPEAPQSWWRDDDQFKRACTRIAWLQSWSDVVQHLQQSIESLSGDEFKLVRAGLLTFKKECETAIAGLNVCIQAYNRFVAIKHKNYVLQAVTP